MVHLPYRSNLFFCSEEIESFENKLNTNHKNLKVKHMIVKKNNFQRKGKAINIGFYKKKFCFRLSFVCPQNKCSIASFLSLVCSPSFVIR